jgi:asparagine synthase (glutamine-hydrolysing)
VALAVAREPWECSPWLGGPAEVSSVDGVTVVADASLFDRASLAGILRSAGSAPTAGAAETIGTVYRMRGAPALLDLNGDFAFVIWDDRRRVMLLGRDFAATRTLHYRIANGRFVAASTLEGVLDLSSDHPSRLDPAGLAEAASGLGSPFGRTCYDGVISVLPGQLLEVGPSLQVREIARWSAPTFEVGSATSFTDAAHELRDLLRQAVAERMAPDLTTVWMSGGYDSSSVFASGRAALSAGTSGALEPISVSYPVGDRGREDEIIEHIIAHHGVRTNWIQSEELPLLGDPARSAARRDDPFAAMYDGFFRRAAQETRALGSRVALSGHGGDVLFDSSLVYFADLLGGLHLRTLGAEWKASREALWGPWQIVREAVTPLVPEELAKRGAELLGRDTPRLHRPASWIRPAVARRIAESGWLPLARRSGESRSSAVARWSLTYPFFTRSQEAASTAARGAGVEYRMPLLDRRVLALAATRPRWERRSGVRSKSLLRAAMKGLLPEVVLLPRLYKTGLTQDYLKRNAREEFPRHVAALQRESVLADLGVIEPSLLANAVDASVGDQDGWIAGHLYFTLQVEYWLRARLNISDRLAA